MSKEFEEVVLKKLDELSYDLKDTKQELRDFAKDTNQRLEKVEKGQETINEKLENVEIELKDTKQELNDFVESTNQRFEEIEVDLKDTKEKVIDLRQRFAVFDFEINRKIDTLFDSDTVNKDNIVSLNVKNYNHDTRITNLENKDLSFAKV